MSEKLTTEERQMLWDIIGPSKGLMAKTAREAAEMTMGRALTDEEWEKFGWKWEEAWSTFPKH